MLESSTGKGSVGIWRLRRRGWGRGIRRKKGRERRERGKEIDDCSRVDPEVPGREGFWSGVALEDMTNSVPLE